MLPQSLSPIDRTEPACVLTFNSNDPCGAGGLAADIGAITSVGAHPLPILAGAYIRDTTHIFDFFPLEGEAVAEQARTALEDIEVHAIKLGFVGTPENLGVIAGISADYPNVPLVAHMPDLSWWSIDQIDAYHDAFVELILPQTSILCASHSTLRRWLLPTWDTTTRPPGARDIAVAAGEQGVSDTLCAALAALLASNCDLPQAFSEALSYLNSSLEGGIHPGMGTPCRTACFGPSPTPLGADASSPLFHSQELHHHDTPR